MDEPSEDNDRLPEPVTWRTPAEPPEADRDLVAKFIQAGRSRIEAALWFEVPLTRIDEILRVTGD